MTGPPVHVRAHPHLDPPLSTNYYIKRKLFGLLLSIDPTCGHKHTRSALTNLTGSAAPTHICQCGSGLSPLHETCSHVHNTSLNQVCQTDPSQFVHETPHNLLTTHLGEARTPTQRRSLTPPDPAPGLHTRASDTVIELQTTQLVS